MPRLFSSAAAVKQTLSSGRFIEVEGILSRGVLVAENISIELEDEHQAKGAVVRSDTFTVNLSEPTLELKIFTVKNMTIYENNSTMPIRHLARRGLRQVNS